MNQIIEILKTQINRPRTLPLLGSGLTLIVLALIIGINDNPPGVGLAYLGLILVAFSCTHHWREASRFGTLFAVAVISFPVLVLLHNIFETINENVGPIIVITQLFQGISVISFVGAVMVVPAAGMVGLLAGLFYLIKSKL